MTWLVVGAVLALIIWASFQASDANTRKWAKRADAWSAKVGPVWKHVKDDVAALRRDWTVWRWRRKNL